MTTIAQRLMAAEVALAQVPAGSGSESAEVAGVRCVRYPIDQPWAVQAKMLELPTAEAFAAVTSWLDSRADGWTVCTLRSHAEAPVFGGLVFWLELVAQTLTSPLPSVVEAPGFDVRPAKDRAELLSVFGADLGPLVTDAHLADESFTPLVGLIDGDVVACAQVRHAAGTAYISGVTVLESQRGKGFGSAITVAASRHALASGNADLVWLTSVPDLLKMYGRLGFRPVISFAQLRNH